MEAFCISGIPNCAEGYIDYKINRPDDENPNGEYEQYKESN